MTALTIGFDDSTPSPLSDFKGARHEADVSICCFYHVDFKASRSFRISWFIPDKRIADFFMPCRYPCPGCRAVASGIQISLRTESISWAPSPPGKSYRPTLPGKDGIVISSFFADEDIAGQCPGT